MTLILVPASFVEKPAFTMTQIFFQSLVQNTRSMGYVPVTRPEPILQDMLLGGYHPMSDVQQSYYQKILDQKKHDVVFAQDEKTGLTTGFTVSHNKDLTTSIDEIYTRNAHDASMKLLLRQIVAKNRFMGQKEVMTEVPNGYMAPFEKNGFKRIGYTPRPHDNKMVYTLD